MEGEQFQPLQPFSVMKSQKGKQLGLNNVMKSEGYQYKEDGSIDGTNWTDEDNPQEHMSRGKLLKPAIGRNDPRYLTPVQRKAKHEVKDRDDEADAKVGVDAEKEKKKAQNKKMLEGATKYEQATGQKYTGPRGRGRPVSGLPGGHKGKGNESRIDDDGNIVKSVIPSFSEMRTAKQMGGIHDRSYLEKSIANEETADYLNIWGKRVYHPSYTASKLKDLGAAAQAQGKEADKIDSDRYRPYNQGKEMGWNEGQKAQNALNKLPDGPMSDEIKSTAGDLADKNLDEAYEHRWELDRRQGEVQHPIQGTGDPIEEAVRNNVRRREALTVDSQASEADLGRAAGYKSGLNANVKKKP